MTKTFHRFGVAGLVASLLIAGAVSAAAQGLQPRRTLGSRLARQATCAVQGQGSCNAQRRDTTESVFDFRNVCFRSLLGINDEVLADSGRFPCTQDWLPGIELGERFGDFTNATMTVWKNRNTGKLVLHDLKFVKALGASADDKALLKEYEHAVDLVSKLLGVCVTCPGLVDPATNLGRQHLNPMDRRIKSQTLLNLAKGQKVEITATEASYVIRAGQPIQTSAPIVEIRLGPIGLWRSNGQNSESVKELTLGPDCSDLLSMKMRVLQEQSKLRDAQRQNLQTIREKQNRERETKTAEAKSASAGNCSISKSASEKISVAEKLGQCDFLLNKDFKKDAKFYLCLFSASWCPPCRREMPRIAKTYAETLKDDPDIELIHFSRDQNDEKAMAWAKAHDVKFPVVKPKGGNPLDLHSRGIPHLFIVKADGTLVEEGHPMRIFNDDKFQELKGGRVATVAKPQTANVAKTETKEVNGIKWNYKIVDGAVVLGGEQKTAIPEATTGALEIPEIIDGMPVRGIGERAFYQCRGLTLVTIPQGVKSIGRGAFHGCMGLESVTIPSSVDSVGKEAFYWCTKLQSLTISNGVTSIGDSAFYADWGLSSVTIPASVRHIGTSAFCYCTGLKSICVSEGNGEYCSLDGVLYNKTRTALIQCPAGKTDSVTIPLSVTNIGYRAFDSCGGLKSVMIPPSVTSIGDFAFSHCSGMSDFIVAEGNSEYCSRDGILYNKAMTRVIQCPCKKMGTVSIPSGVTTIGRSAFSNCEGLASIDIPLSVTNLEQGAFSGCRGLTTVTIPSSVTSIGSMAFQFCNGLQSVTIPESVTSIGRQWAFYCCHKLKSVTMCGERPESCYQVFRDCENLGCSAKSGTSVYLPKTNRIHNCLVSLVFRLLRSNYCPHSQSPTSWTSFGSNLLCSATTAAYKLAMIRRSPKFAALLQS